MIIGGHTMITSILLTGMYNIGINKNNKIQTPDGITVDIKDIPFVRYKFDSYGEAQIEFIKKNIERFPCVHLIEIDLNEHTFEVLERIEKDNIRIAKFIYITATKETVITGITQETENLLNKLMDYEFDSLNIRDPESLLYPMALSNIKSRIREITGLRDTEIGVCGGPCCFYDGNACLTAVKAREILAIYTKDVDNVVVPSSNHEGNINSIDDQDSITNKCGCIRYYTFNSDVEAPVCKEKKAKKTIEISGDVKAEISVNMVEKKAKEKLKGYKKVIW